MKALHYVPVVFAYLLTLLVAIMACSEFAQAYARMQADPIVWPAMSRAVAGLLSLGLAWFLWIWAGHVRTNTRVTLQLKGRLEHEQIS